MLKTYIVQDTTGPATGMARRVEIDTTFRVAYGPEIVVATAAARCGAKGSVEGDAVAFVHFVERLRAGQSQNLLNTIVK